jgi:uncharacterized membrane protein
VVQTEQESTDTQMDQMLGNLLRVGVLTAALVVAVGGMAYLVRHGQELIDDRIFQFHGEPGNLKSPVGTIEDAMALHSRGVIQLGLLLLIATPVARVILSVFAFARQRDFTYVVITLIVLVVLLYSLFIGHS